MLVIESHPQEARCRSVVQYNGRTADPPLEESGATVYRAVEGAHIRQTIEVDEGVGGRSDVHVVPLADRLAQALQGFLVYTGILVAENKQEPVLNIVL